MGLAVYSIWHREIVRFLKNRSRVTSSLLQPIIFWLLFAGALRSSFTPGGVDSYGEYFFVGTLAMISLFTAIFSTITVIEDRKEGFLQGVLVAPVPRAAIALGKITGGATLGWLLAVVFFCLAPFVVSVPLGIGAILGTLAVLLLVSFAVTGLGFTIAWLMDSTAGYHGIMMVLLMPMLLLSGAFFPSQGAHPVMAWLMAVNPLTYGVGALRHALYGAGVQGVPPMVTCLLVTVLFAAGTFSLGTLVVLRRTARDAQ